jgi:hypothetical protein
VGPAWAALVALAILLLAIWAGLLVVGRRAWATTMSETTWPVAGLLSVAAAWRTACSSAVAPRVRRAWTFFAAGFTANFIGDAIFTVQTFGGRAAPFPSPADPFYLARGATP